MKALQVTRNGSLSEVLEWMDDDEGGMTGGVLRPLCAGNFSIVGVMAAYMSNLPSPIRRMGFNPFDRETAVKVHADLLRLIESGDLRPVVSRHVRPEDAGAALEDHEQRRTRGRTVS